MNEVMRTGMGIQQITLPPVDLRELFKPTPTAGGGKRPEAPVDWNFQIRKFLWMGAVGAAVFGAYWFFFVRRKKTTVVANRRRRTCR